MIKFKHVSSIFIKKILLTLQLKLYFDIYIYFNDIAQIVSLVSMVYINNFII